MGGEPIPCQMESGHCGRDICEAKKAELTKQVNGFPCSFTWEGKLAAHMDQVRPGHGSAPVRDAMRAMEKREWSLFHEVAPYLLALALTFLLCVCCIRGQSAKRKLAKGSEVRHHDTGLF